MQAIRNWGRHALWTGVFSLAVGLTVSAATPTGRDHAGTGSTHAGATKAARLVTPSREEMIRFVALLNQPRDGSDKRGRVERAQDWLRTLSWEGYGKLSSLMRDRSLFEAVETDKAFLKEIATAAGITIDGNLWTENYNALVRAFNSLANDEILDSQRREAALAEAKDKKEKPFTKRELETRRQAIASRLAADTIEIDRGSGAPADQGARKKRDEQLARELAAINSALGVEPPKGEPADAASHVRAFYDGPERFAKKAGNEPEETARLLKALRSHATDDATTAEAAPAYWAARRVLNGSSRRELLAAAPTSGMGTSIPHAGVDLVDRSTNLSATQLRDELKKMTRKDFDAFYEALRAEPETPPGFDREIWGKARIRVFNEMQALKRSPDYAALGGSPVNPGVPKGIRIPPDQYTSLIENAFENFKGDGTKSDEDKLFDFLTGLSFHELEKFFKWLKEAVDKQPADSKLGGAEWRRRAAWLHNNIAILLDGRPLDLSKTHENALRDEAERAKYDLKKAQEPGGRYAFLTGEIQELSGKKRSASEDRLLAQYQKEHALWNQALGRKRPSGPVTAARPADMLDLYYTDRAAFDKEVLGDKDKAKALLSHIEGEVRKLDAMPADAAKYADQSRTRARLLQVYWPTRRKQGDLAHDPLDAYRPEIVRKNDWRGLLSGTPDAFAKETGAHLSLNEAAFVDRFDDLTDEERRKWLLALNVKALQNFHMRVAEAGMPAGFSADKWNGNTRQRVLDLVTAIFNDRLETSKLYERALNDPKQAALFVPHELEERRKAALIELRDVTEALADPKTGATAKKRLQEEREQLIKEVRLIAKHLKESPPAQLATAIDYLLLLRTDPVRFETEVAKVKARGDQALEDLVHELIDSARSAEDVLKHRDPLHPTDEHYDAAASLAADLVNVHLPAEKRSRRPFSITDLHLRRADLDRKTRAAAKEACGDTRNVLERFVNAKGARFLDPEVALNEHRIFMNRPDDARELPLPPVTWPKTADEIEKFQKHAVNLSTGQLLALQRYYDKRTDKPAPVARDRFPTAYQIAKHAKGSIGWDKGPKLYSTGEGSGWNWLVDGDKVYRVANEKADNVDKVTKVRDAFGRTFSFSTVDKSYKVGPETPDSKPYVDGTDPATMLRRIVAARTSDAGLYTGIVFEALGRDLEKTPRNEDIAEMLKETGIDAAAMAEFLFHNAAHARALKDMAPVECSDMDRVSKAFLKLRHQLIVEGSGLKDGELTTARLFWNMTDQAFETYVWGLPSQKLPEFLTGTQHMRDAMEKQNRLWPLGNEELDRRLRLAAKVLKNMATDMLANFSDAAKAGDTGRIDALRKFYKNVPFLQIFGGITQANEFETNVPPEFVEIAKDVLKTHGSTFNTIGTLLHDKEPRHRAFGYKTPDGKEFIFLPDRADGSTRMMPLKDYQDELKKRIDNYTEKLKGFYEKMAKMETGGNRLWEGFVRAWFNDDYKTSEHKELVEADKEMREALHHVRDLSPPSETMSELYKLTQKAYKTHGEMAQDAADHATILAIGIILTPIAIAAAPSVAVAGITARFILPPLVGGAFGAIHNAAKQNARIADAEKRGEKIEFNWGDFWKETGTSAVAATVLVNVPGAAYIMPAAGMYVASDAAGSAYVNFKNGRHWEATVDTATAATSLFAIWKLGAGKTAEAPVPAAVADAAVGAKPPPAPASPVAAASRWKTAMKVTSGTFIVSSLALGGNIWHTNPEAAKSFSENGLLPPPALHDEQIPERPKDKDKPAPAGPTNGLVRHAALLREPFLTHLATLPKNGHWVDVGGNNVAAIEEYLAPKANEHFTKDAIGEKGMKALTDIYAKKPFERARVTTLTYDFPPGVTIDEHDGQVKHVKGKLLTDDGLPRALQREDAAGVDLLTDTNDRFLSEMSRHRPEKAIAAYLSALKAGGAAYLVSPQLLLSRVHTKDGKGSKPLGEWIRDMIKDDPELSKKVTVEWAGKRVDDPLILRVKESVAGDLALAPFPELGLQGEPLMTEFGLSYRFKEAP